MNRRQRRGSSRNAHAAERAPLNALDPSMIFSADDDAWSAAFARRYASSDLRVGCFAAHRFPTTQQWILRAALLAGVRLSELPPWALPTEADLLRRIFPEHCVVARQDRTRRALRGFRERHRLSRRSASRRGACR